ncbi:MAG: asparaginase [Hyphomicrobiales bacterium]
MTNPILVEVTRGGIVESVHHGAYCVVDAKDDVQLSAGKIDVPVFPRSAIKAFQALPAVASGVVDVFGFSDEEIALMCSSHSGEERHVAGSSSMLKKADFAECDYECGAHWPYYQRRTNQMIAAGEKPSQLHNNCSGKHAGMLAFARQLDAETAGYINPDHAVQREIAKTIGELCDYDLGNAARGVDGCSVPTWAVPLENLALGFARFGTGEGLNEAKAKAAKRIIAAVRAHPFMVAGTGRFCTEIMEAIPRLFIKTGAEGVFCGCIPHAGLGFALKCEDGATRASEIAAANMLLKLDVWTVEEKAAFKNFMSRAIRNRRDIETGVIRGADSAFG